MKIIVLVKETLNTEAKFVPEKDQKPKLEDGRFIINPFDEYAIEAALQLVEEKGGEVVLYSLGRQEAQVTLRTALAMGAHRAVLITSGARNSKTISRILGDKIKENDPDFDLIISGWISVDDNRAQVPGRLSKILNIPLANVIMNIELKGDELICEREGDTEQEIVKLTMPAFIAVQRGINIPRYPTVRNIMDAKQKRFDVISADEYEDDLEGVVYKMPPKRTAGKIIDGSDPKLAAKLLVEELLKEKLL